MYVYEDHGSGKVVVFLKHEIKKVYAVICWSLGVLSNACHMEIVNEQEEQRKKNIGK